MKLIKSHMKPKWPQSVLALILVALFVGPVENLYAAGPDKEGVKDGGGGNIVILKDSRRPVLLDLVMLNANLNLASQADQLDISKTKNKYAEFEPLNASDKAIIRMAEQKVNTLITVMSKPDQKLSRELLYLINYSLAQVQYIRTGHYFKTQNKYYLPDSYRNINPQVKTVILFLFNNGAAISSPIWDKLDIETKVGLIIHEGLRQVQVQYQNVFTDLDDSRLQLLTALILKANPTSDFKFDQWMTPSMLNYFSVTDIQESFYQVESNQVAVQDRLDRRIFEIQKISNSNLIPLVNNVAVEATWKQKMLYDFLRSRVKERIIEQTENP